MRSSALPEECSLIAQKNNTIQTSLQEKQEISTFHAQSKMVNETHVYTSDGLAMCASLAIPRDS